MKFAIELIRIGREQDPLTSDFLHENNYDDKDDEKFVFLYAFEQLLKDRCETIQTNKQIYKASKIVMISLNKHVIAMKIIPPCPFRFT